MVTAIALQAKRGIVACRECRSEFKPRAHRVTPARERAYKKRLREQRMESEQRLEIEVHAQQRAAQHAVNESTQHAASGPDKKPPQAGKAALQDAESVAELFLQRLGASIDALGDRFGERLAGSLMAGLPPVTGAKASEPALARQQAEISEQLAQQNLNRPRSEEGELKMKNDNDDSHQQRTAADGGQLDKARQTIARQKMLLDYQKLRHESEKLEVEKKKLELERVKLEILRKHNLLEDKKLQSAGEQTTQRIMESKPLVEYDVTADILPRTPTAIEPDPRIQKPTLASAPVEANAAKKAVHLELMPSEPKSMFRRNIGTKGNKLK
ncbi:MAG: hypothetical protein HKO07_03335 [Pseudomonadales bacterium]|nr:hypothetical protein [Pseudomonadales bacterium]